MDFQKIKTVEHADFYLEVVFKRASKFKTPKDKIEYVTNYLNDTFESIVKSFPSLHNLSEFHQELIETKIQIDLIKKNIAALDWARKTIRKLSHSYKEAENPKIFYGRVKSILYQINDSLLFLKKSRIMLNELPNIRNLYTVCIAGFPNIGKTTLLSKITSSKPEINSYAFTTKNLNIGYIIKEREKIQVIDTPGTLSRKDKMNNIEKQAYLALKYVANLVVYIIDLTEPYSLELQHKLLEEIKKYDKEIIIYFSKQDILQKEIIYEYSKKYKIEILSDNDLIEKILKTKNSS